MVYPAFGVVFAKGITGFSEVDPHVRRFDGDRNALWCVSRSRNKTISGFNLLTLDLGYSALPLFLLARSPSRTTSSHLLPLL
jgi:hypothetical protein